MKQNFNSNSFFTTYFLLLIITVIVPCWSEAQQLNTDRPDQSDGAAVVDKGKFQLESSFYFTTIDQNQHASILSSLLRYGLANKLELRLLAEQGHHRDLFIEQTAHSQFPLALSIKWNLLKDKETMPDLSIVSYLQLPFTNGAQPSLWAPGILLILEKEYKPFTITLKWMIHASAGTSVDHQPNNYFVNSGFAVQIN